MLCFSHGSETIRRWHKRKMTAISGDVVARSFKLSIKKSQFRPATSTLWQRKLTYQWRNIIINHLYMGNVKLPRRLLDGIWCLPHWGYDIESMPMFLSWMSDIPSGKWQTIIMQLNIEKVDLPMKRGDFPVQIWVYERLWLCMASVLPWPWPRLMVSHPNVGVLPGSFQAPPDVDGPFFSTPAEPLLERHLRANKIHGRIFLLVGGWATPLKNMVRQLGWLATQY